MNSREYLHKFTKQGVELGSRMHINKRNSGISYIFNYMGSYYQINYGYSYYQNKRMYSNCSKFFIQRFNSNLEVIDSIDYREVKEDKLYNFNGEVIGHKTANEKIVLLMDQGFLFLDSNLKFDMIKYLGRKKEWAKLETENFFYFQNGVYKLEDISASDYLYIKLKNGDIEQYSKVGEYINTFESKNVFHEIYFDNSLRVIGDVSKTQLLNSMNRHILEAAGIFKVLKTKSHYILGFKSGLFIIKSDQLVK